MHVFVRASMAGCINDLDLVMAIPVWKLSIVVTYKQVAALYSAHYRQVPLVGAGCFRQVAALCVALLQRQAQRTSVSPWLLVMQQSVVECILLVAAHPLGGAGGLWPYVHYTCPQAR